MENKESVLNRINQTTGLNYSRLYMADGGQLSTAAFLDTVKEMQENNTDPFPKLEALAENQAESLYDYLKQQLAESSWLVSTYISSLPEEVQNKVDQKFQSYMDSFRRSRNGLMGALIRHNIITPELVGWDKKNKCAVIKVPESMKENGEAVGLLKYVDNFRLSEKSLRKLQVKWNAAAPTTPVTVVETPPEKPIVSAVIQPQKNLKTLVRSLFRRTQPSPANQPA